MSKHRKRKHVIGPNKVLTQAEQQQLIDYLAGRQRSAISKKFVRFETATAGQALLIVELFLCTGLRVAELAALRVADTPIVLGLDAVMVYRGKNNKDRTVPISARLAKLIEEFVKDYRNQTLPRHVRTRDYLKPLFYSTQRRRPFSTNGLYRKIRQAAEHAGLLKRLTPHMLRHSFATNALRANVNIYKLQMLMGHESLATTAGYLHLVDVDKGLGNTLDVRGTQAG